MLVSCVSICVRAAPCVVHDGVEPVRYGEDSAVLKLGADGGLDEVVGLQVDGSRGLVQDEDPGLPQEGSGQAHQLPLTHTEDTATSQENA